MGCDSCLYCHIYDRTDWQYFGMFCRLEEPPNAYCYQHVYRQPVRRRSGYYTYMFTSNVAGGCYGNMVYGSCYVQIGVLPNGKYILPV